MNVCRHFSQNSRSLKNTSVDWFDKNKKYIKKILMLEDGRMDCLQLDSQTTAVDRFFIIIINFVFDRLINRCVSGRVCVWWWVYLRLHIQRVSANVPFSTNKLFTNFYVCCMRPSHTYRRWHQENQYEWKTIDESHVKHQQ